MKVSQKRKSAIYNAIHEGVMTARIALQKHPETTNRQDYIVAQAEQDIWKRVRVALGIAEQD